MSAALALDRPSGSPEINCENWEAAADRYARSGAWLLALTALGRAHRTRPNSLDLALRRAELAWRAQVPDAELVRLDELAAEHPSEPALLAGRAALLHRLGRDAEAAELLEAACALKPDDAKLLAMLGGMMASDLQLPGAATALARALTITPDDHILRHDYGVVLYRMHRFPEARRELRTAAGPMGDAASLLSNLANVTLCLGAQYEALRLAERGVAVTKSYLSHRTLLNVLPYAPEIDAARLLAAARACGAAAPRPPAPPVLANAPEPERKLRIGLLGGVLKTHPVAWLTIAGFENLDPVRFELVGIAATIPRDPLSRRFRTVASEWIEPAGKNDAALAEAIRAREIDIVIDLGGYGDLGRMTACAWRLAPVQVKWVGMQAHSTGLAEMDWFITDRWETPAKLAGFYSERLLTLPDGYVCYSPPSDAPAVAPLPMAARGHVTFGCFCNIAKVNPAVIGAWSAVLAAVPGSRFVLKSYPLADPETAARFGDAFAAHGIAPERIELRGGSGHRAFLAEWGDIDIALDTFPYAGGLTTVEALWMGVPTITIPGETFSSRHSLSHLSNVGLADWAADNVPAYVAQAVRRAGDPESLASLRAGLRAQMQTSPLCDGRRFGTALGTALRHAWRDWCGGVNRSPSIRP